MCVKNILKYIKKIKILHPIFKQKKECHKNIILAPRIYLKIQTARLESPEKVYGNLD